MVRRRLLWQLFPAFLLVTLVPLAIFGGFTAHSIRTFYLNNTREDLRARSALLMKDLFERETLIPPEEIDRLLEVQGENSGTRFTVIAPDGRVLGDSIADPAEMDNHADRPEVRQALEGLVGESFRFSHTAREEMLYQAYPLEAEGEVAAVLRASLPLTRLNTVLRSIQIQLLTVLGIIALLVAGVSLFFTRRISRPLEELRHGAERFAAGDLTQRLYAPDSEEIGGLAEGMNQMAAQLEERMTTALSQRNELEAVLESMAEGVLAVDNEQRILRMNESAGRLAGINIELARGRSLQEVIRNRDLQSFVARALRDQKPVEGDITFHGEKMLYLRAHATVLRDGAGRGIGALVVLNDVTRLRRLENVRRDFVANVSHELKTPVTSIKGFVETLLDGAIENRQEAERFLNIILNQSNRLSKIIEDLLSLSRIEQEAERHEIPMETGPVRAVLSRAIQCCELARRNKDIRILLECDEQLQALMNEHLLEQAVVNLIDNAIKYSDAGSKIEVGARADGRETTIYVRDEGCGIPREHQGRLFERFYRVDKARSRTLGGTGLGLAIVKHIAQAHGGRASVESVLNEGSVFSIHLPSRPSAAAHPSAASSAA